MTRTSLLETFAIPSAEEEELAPGPQPAARSERARRVVVAIPLAAIQEASPLQTRQVTFDPQQFAEDAELLASVRQYGVIEPLLVQLLATPFGAPVRYRLIFGNRRAQAARLAGQDSVPAIVARTGEPMDALTIAENSGRRELTPYEKARVLLQLKKQTPDIAVAELVKITGWAQPTVYALLAAYEKSPPVLRKVFAAGRAAPRTIQELQPIFAAAPEADHARLAQLLSGQTHAAIVRLRQAVQLGQAPLDAAEQMSLLHDPAGDRPAHSEPAGQSAPGEPDRPGRAPALPARPVRKENPPAALVAGEDAMLRALVELTGVGRSAAERLLEAAAAAQLTYPTLCLACLYAARGGAEDQALELARLAFRHRKAGGALRRQIDHLHALSASRSWAASLPGGELQSFFQILFQV